MERNAQKQEAIQEEARRQLAIAQKHDAGNQQPQPMDGVDNYPLCITMTAEELARQRVAKRSLSSMTPLKSAADDNISKLKIEQDDDVLMNGRQEVWDLDTEQEEACNHKDSGSISSVDSL